eukprot:COSAG06_NODE_1417_length_9526_cov_9.513207_11_plen_96_part_00
MRTRGLTLASSPLRVSHHAACLPSTQGWNTWDHFRCSGGGKGAGLGEPCNAAMDNCVSEVLIRQVADAVVARGLKERGCELVPYSCPVSLFRSRA